MICSNEKRRLPGDDCAIRGRLIKSNGTLMQGRIGRSMSWCGEKRLCCGWNWRLLTPCLVEKPTQSCPRVEKPTQSCLSTEMKTSLCLCNPECFPAQLNLQEFIFGGCPMPGVIAELSCVIPGREKLITCAWRSWDVCGSRASGFRGLQEVCAELRAEKKFWWCCQLG